MRSIILRAGIPTLMVSGMLAISTTAHGAGVPSNDDCSTPIDISGEGTFPYDNTDATTSATPGTDQCLAGSSFIVEKDLWYRWTSTCDGLVEISTCGFTDVNTRIAVYEDIVCPVDPKFLVCCGDDECGKQTRITCEVQCDVTYLIQVGSSTTSESGPGSLDIACMSDPCPSGGGDPPADCPDCCEIRPEYDAEGYLAFGTGQVAFMTRDKSDIGLPNGTVLVAMDLSDEGTAPVGVNWLAPKYAHPDWTKTKLGTVFGVAIDNEGAVYVAHTSIYSQSASTLSRDAIGTLGNAGSIYKIDPFSGVPSEFVQLPASQDPNTDINGDGANELSSERWTGLGNIAWDCDRDVLWASNFEDGRIYRIDSSGVVLGTYDHATGVITNDGLPEATDTPGFAPYGELVWAVCPTEDRLYYSVWNEDEYHPSVTGSNEIWSVEIDAAGEFVAASGMLELQLPPKVDSQGDPLDYSSPVSDIVTDDVCCLIIAERSMNGPTESKAHRARLLKYCHDGDAWVPSPDEYSIPYAPGGNCAGGVDFDYGPDQQVWATGDSLSPNSATSRIYGLIGLPALGGDSSASILIDEDEETLNYDKFEMGSVEMTCWEENEKGCWAEGELECIVDENGVSSDYALELTVTNESGQDAHFINIVGPVSSNVIPLPPLGDGQSIVLNLTLYGPIVGDTVCLTLTLMNADLESCCGMEVCMDVPECDCSILEVLDVQCIKEGVYTFTLSVTNLYDPHIIEHLFFNADSGSPNTFIPEWVDIPSLAPFNKAIVGPITVQTTFVAGDKISVDVALHNEQLKECCVDELEFDLPECDGKSGCTPDLNGDGIVDGADLGLLLANFGGSGLGDIDCDGDVDGADLGLLLAAWGPVGP